MSDPLHDNVAAERSLDSFDLGLQSAVLLYAVNPDNPGFASPVKIGDLGGGGSGSGGSAALHSLSNATLTLTGSAQALPTPPTGATAARISMRGGDASITTGGTPPTASSGDLWNDGSIWQVDGPDVAALRAITSTGPPVLNITWLGSA